MGLETIAQAGLSMVQSSQTKSNAKAQANATVQQGALDAQNIARKTQLDAGAQTERFLNSGFELRGTPAADAAGTYATGLADVNQTISNANTRSKNIYAQARAGLLQSVMKQTSGLGLGGIDISKTFASAFDPGTTFNPITWNQAPVPGSPEDQINWNDISPAPGIKQVGG